MKPYFKRLLLATAVSAAAAAASAAPAFASGTVLIQQRDGVERTYAKVHIAIRDAAMAITSSDGRGMLVLGKAACSKVGELLKCLPYDATLFQNGQRVHIPLQSGTVWLNPTGTNQPMSHSSAQIPPRGVLLLVKTKAGTYVSLTGRVDEVAK